MVHSKRDDEDLPCSRMTGRWNKGHRRPMKYLHRLTRVIMVQQQGRYWLLEGTSGK